MSWALKSWAQPQIISDEELIRVHANANFGTRTPREVVNEGVRQCAVGFSIGYTMMTILQEHGLLHKSSLSRALTLNARGKEYARAIHHNEPPTLYHMHSKVLQGFYQSDVYVSAHDPATARYRGLKAFTAWLDQEIKDLGFLSIGTFCEPEDPDFSANKTAVIEAFEDELKNLQPIWGNAMIQRSI